MRAALALCLSLVFQIVHAQDSTNEPETVLVEGERPGLDRGGGQDEWYRRAASEGDDG